MWGVTCLGLSSFRCGCESQMDLFDNGCKYLNLSTFLEKVWSGYKADGFILCSSVLSSDDLGWS